MSMGFPVVMYLYMSLIMRSGSHLDSIKKPHSVALYGFSVRYDRVLRGLHAFENPGGTHAGTDAHGYHAVFQISAAHRVDRGSRADCAGCAERMAQRNCAAV